MTLRSRIAIALASVTALSAAGIGAPASAVDHHRRTSQAVAWTRLLPASSTDARRAVGRAERRATGADGYRVRYATQDSTGVTHVHLARSYAGLPVLGGDEIVHQAADGTVLGIAGDTTPLTLSVSPSVTAAQARRDAIGGVQGGAALAVDVSHGSPRLVWQVTTHRIRHDGTPSRLLNLIDAHTGRVVSTEQQVETLGGRGVAHYAGSVPLRIVRVRTRFALRDLSRGGTFTTDFHNRVDSLSCQNRGVGCLAGTLVTSRTRTFGNGWLRNRATAAADAQYAANETWDFYLTTFGRRGIWGTGRGADSRVHYGYRYVNAFWDGFRMTYGDGDGYYYGPFTTLDITGHEMTHGVTEHTAGLEYFGDAGALDESTSDVFGTMVEFFARNPKEPGDYLIGEAADLRHHLGLRRMDRPSWDGHSPNCYADTPAFHNLDPHFGSGVGNHFFYLLAEGSGAKTINGVRYDSPTCDGSTVTGIGRTAAARIWYRALTTYMTPDETYPMARADMLRAAADLFPPAADGTPSPQYAATSAAWGAVGVS